MTPNCHTCLYMATHEHCTDCLRTKEDYAALGRGENPPCRYTNYEEGNWTGRLLWRQADGSRNIVIGGQGEAEVNTKQSPAAASANLHYVAEQCGYIVGHLRHKGNSTLLLVNTHDGLFDLEWVNSQLEHIWRVQIDAEGNHVGRESSWDRADAELFSRESVGLEPLEV